MNDVNNSKLVVKIEWKQLARSKKYQIHKNKAGYQYMIKRCEQYVQKHQSFQFCRLKRITGEPIKSIDELLKASYQFQEKHPQSEFTVAGQVANKGSQQGNFKKKREGEVEQQSKVMQLDKRQQQNELDNRNLMMPEAQVSSIQKKEANQSLSINDQALSLWLHGSSEHPQQPQQPPTLPQPNPQLKQQQSVNISHNPVTSSNSSKSSNQQNSPIKPQYQRTKQQELTIKFKRLKKQFSWTDADIEPYKKQPYTSMTLHDLIQHIRDKKPL